MNLSTVLWLSSWGLLVVSLLTGSVTCSQPLHNLAYTAISWWNETDFFPPATFQVCFKWAWQLDGTTAYVEIQMIEALPGMSLLKCVELCQHWRTTYLWYTHRSLLHWRHLIHVKHPEASAANFQRCGRNCCCGRQAIPSAVLYHSNWFSGGRGFLERTLAAQMKREPCVKFKWASLKLRSMQHIAKLPPLPTDGTYCYVTYKLAGGEAARRSPRLR